MDCAGGHTFEGSVEICKLIHGNFTDKNTEDHDLRLRRYLGTRCPAAKRETLHSLQGKYSWEVKSCAAARVIGRPPALKTFFMGMLTWFNPIS